MSDTDATTLRPRPQSAGEARRFVAAALDRHGVSSQADIVVLLTSELVTNAILHAGTEVGLALDIQPHSVRVEVTDHSSHHPHRRHSPPDVPGGHGLELVEALSRSWGVVSRPAGKSVWFEVTLDG